MKLGVLALDYDGTIAIGDALDATVAQAIGCWRTIFEDMKPDSRTGADGRGDFGDCRCDPEPLRPA